MLRLLARCGALDLIMCGPVTVWPSTGLYWRRRLGGWPFFWGRAYWATALADQQESSEGEHVSRMLLPPLCLEQASPKSADIDRH